MIRYSSSAWRALPHLSPTCDRWFTRFDHFDGHSGRLTDLLGIAVGRWIAIDGHHVELIDTLTQRLANRNGTIRVDRKRHIRGGNLIITDAVVGIAAIIIRGFDLRARIECTGSPSSSIATYSA